MATKKRSGTERLSLDALIADFNKEQGDDVIVKGSDMLLDEVPRITTGILGFDVALGGGWPVNQWHEIIGDESSGKTVVALKTLAANQAANPEFECLWIAAEDFEAKWAKDLGVDLDRVTIVNSNVLEKVYALVLRAIDSRAVDMVVIDSLPALVTEEEDEKKMDESVVGITARLNGKFFRKAQKAGKRSLVEEDRYCTGLMINQWREKIGVMWGDNRTTPGGRAKNYAYYTRVEVKRDEWLTDGTKDKEKVGQTISILTIKNKSYKPRQTAEIDFYFAEFGEFSPGQFDTIKEVVAGAIGAEIIEKSGGWYKYEGEQWQGIDKCLAGIRADPALYASMYYKVFAHYLPGVTPPALPEVEEPKPKGRRRVVRRG